MANHSSEFKHLFNFGNKLVLGNVPAKTEFKINLNAINRKQNYEFMNSIYYFQLDKLLRESSTYIIL